jgi:hypothetical protein
MKKRKMKSQSIYKTITTIYQGYRKNHSNHQGVISINSEANDTTLRRISNVVCILMAQKQIYPTPLPQNGEEMGINTDDLKQKFSNGNLRIMSLTGLLKNSEVFIGMDILDIEEGYKSSLNFLSLAQKYKRQFSSS